MPKNDARRVLAAITSEPWAILPGYLETIVEIAHRHGDPEALAVKTGQPLESAERITVRDGVAVIPVTGPIFRYSSLFTRISGATSVELLARDFRAALDDPSVRAVALEIDSPGGQIAGIHEFAAQIYAARGVKPLAAYVGATGASAAYWIAAAAGRIVADDTAVLGSIGVVMSLPRSDGKTLEIVSSRSPKKRLDPETDDGRRELVRHLDELAAVFLADVATFRGVSVQTVETDFGQGGVLVGAGAVAAGMADALGSLEGVLAELSAPRPLAGTFFAMEETMPASTALPGGGQTAAPPAQNPVTAAPPAPVAQTAPAAAPPIPAQPAAATPAAPAQPGVASILALAAVILGAEAGQKLTAAMSAAAEFGVTVDQYAALAAKLAPAPATAQQPAPPASASHLTLLQATLAKPAAPGGPADPDAAERARVRASMKSGLTAGQGRK
ncbi:S49 family peptidase [Desulfovibrio sulfodismutans]|uniref:S49 family peptidase n=1 Tax=Desulfolutivibrio sulfodismutans TaxID=63561 RepID=A0A7K3NLK6_9BACT|nr:S49 family peptidase [Desulfolutivibrio sulfodismutans]NDY56665.1 S49 family peptidase [Desulfolutivibrio sulfodismutans]